MAIKLRMVLATLTACMLFAMPAHAAGECKKEKVTAESPPNVVRSLGAYPASLFAWRKAVKDKFGAEWNSWRFAEERVIDCQEIDTSAGKRWVCKRTAIPCKGGLVQVTQPTRTCKDEPLSSYGRREKTEDAAIEQAIWGWRIDVRKKYGKEWAEWEVATDVDIDCDTKSGGRIQCIAFARPCLK